MQLLVSFLCLTLSFHHLHNSVFCVLAPQHSHSYIYITLEKLSLSSRLKLNMITTIAQKEGLNRDLNPGPPAPKAGIIPLDH